MLSVPPMNRTLIASHACCSLFGDGEGVTRQGEEVILFLADTISRESCLLVFLAAGVNSFYKLHCFILQGALPML
jgi:hypothetical protein